MIKLVNLVSKKVVLESWYHGTPDSREIERDGGFTHRTMSVDYITDLDAYKRTMLDMQRARDSGDDDLYHKLLDTIISFKEKYTYKKPVFLSSEYSVAKTYADPRRYIDYQSAKEKVYEVDVDCSRVVRIEASGERFKFIGVNRVKRGFMGAGVSEKEIDDLINKFNYYVKEGTGIKTDVIAAIGNWLNFDCIDVVGVLDSYHGGTVKSTVRMVLDPLKIRIKR
jgi:glycosyltransferase involved in cell wall biosynthesis